MVILFYKVYEFDFVYIVIFGVGDVFFCFVFCVNYIWWKSVVIVKFWNCGISKLMCIILKKNYMLVDKLNCMYDF